MWKWVVVTIGVVQTGVGYLVSRKIGDCKNGFVVNMGGCTKEVYKRGLYTKGLYKRDFKKGSCLNGVAPVGHL